jgi:general secretion pathway protein D
VAELDLVDEGIQFLNSSPAQVSIAVKFVKMSEEQAQALTGIIHPLPQLDQAGVAKPSLASTNRPSIRGFMTDRQFREVIRSMETNSGIDIISAPQVTTLSGRQTQIAVQNARMPVMEGSQIQVPSPTAEMNNRNSMPSAAIVKEQLTTTIPTGPCLDVIPRVLPDGNAIRMTLTASVTNFQSNGNPDTP